MSRHEAKFELDAGLAGLSPVGLADLTSRAAMMTRHDAKYVVQGDVLMPLMPRLAERFDILEINDRRAFAYATRYFDDAARRCYHQHHQGVRQSFKLRVRRYADSGLCFAEIKLKGPRGLTVKHRMELAAFPDVALPAAALNFATTAYRNHYGKPFLYDPQPALDVLYRRITLVSKDGAERMTLDTGLSFQTPKTAINLSPDQFIVETKSPRERGIADRILADAGLRAVPKCSKYCIGMAALGEVARFNRFLPALRALGLQDAVNR